MASSLGITALRGKVYSKTFEKKDEDRERECETDRVKDEERNAEESER